MITAKEANKKTFESERMRELLTEEHYQEILKWIENEINKSIKDGYFSVYLNTGSLFPFKDKIIKELIDNGYCVEIDPSNIAAESLIIGWQ